MRIYVSLPTLLLLAIMTSCVVGDKVFDHGLRGNNAGGLKAVTSSDESLDVKKIRALPSPLPDEKNHTVASDGEQENGDLQKTTSNRKLAQRIRKKRRPRRKNRPKNKRPMKVKGPQSEGTGHNKPGCSATKQRLCCKRSKKPDFHYYCLSLECSTTHCY
jgi:hypothetical protein